MSRTRCNYNYYLYTPITINYNRRIIDIYNFVILQQSVGTDAWTVVDVSAPTGARACTGTPGGDVKPVGKYLFVKFTSE